MPREKAREAAQVDRTQIQETLKTGKLKGEGKGGSLGQAVGSESKPVAVNAEEKIPPALQANTRNDVQKMFDTKYYIIPEDPFWDGKDLKKVDKGMHVLWKKVPLGKNGGDSTKLEVFHGECHGWEKDKVLLS